MPAPPGWALSPGPGVIWLEGPLVSPPTGSRCARWEQKAWRCPRGEGIGSFHSFPAISK